MATLAAEAERTEGGKVFQQLVGLFVGHGAAFQGGFNGRFVGVPDRLGQRFLVDVAFDGVLGGDEVGLPG